MNQQHQPQFVPPLGMGVPQRMRRRKFTAAEKEFAVGLLNRGWSCRRVSRKLGCSSSSPIRWRQAMRRRNARAQANAVPNIQAPQPPVAVPAGNQLNQDEQCVIV